MFFKKLFVISTTLLTLWLTQAFYLPITSVEAKGEDVIQGVLEWDSIGHIKQTATKWTASWAEGIQQFWIEVLTNIVRPVIIIIWLIVAIIGFYGLMSSDKAEDITKSLNYIIRGTIWIVIMFFAPFLVNQLTGTTWQEGIITELKNIIWWGSAMTLWDMLYKAISPLKKLGFFVVSGVLFIMLLVNALQMLFNPNDDVTTKARVMFTRNAFGIVIILLAKTIVDWIYWEEGKTILQNPDLGWLGAVISRGISFLATIMLIILIYMWFTLITRPLDDQTYEKLKRSIIYMLLWILIMWWAYIIARFLIIQ